MRFAHLSDCHLGGWRQLELKELNLESFKEAIDVSIEKNVDFVLITGDLFDSAYPPVEILEHAFEQLKKLNDKNIKCYYIAGSHDYSASGKTFLTVLEKAGFCKNIFNPEEKGEGEKKTIFLNPILHENIALYGYPGKRSGMEVKELENVKLQASPGLFRIYALHTCIEDAIGNIPADFIKKEDLPEAEYYALGHLHIKYEDGKFVYAGPTFPNNFQELEELKYGSFYIVDTNPFNTERKEIKLKDIEAVNIEIKNSLIATEKIISELNKKEIEDKIVLLRVRGKLEKGKVSNIDFKSIEDFVKKRGGYCFLKSTSKIVTEQPEFNMEVENMDKMEDEIIGNYMTENPSKFNDLIPQIMSSLSLEKKEDETNSAFESRIYSNINKIFEIDDN